MNRSCYWKFGKQLSLSFLCYKLNHLINLFPGFFPVCLCFSARDVHIQNYSIVEQNRSVFNPDVFKVNKHREKNNLPTCMVLDKVNSQLSRYPFYILFTSIVLHIHCFQFLLRSRPKEDNSFIQFLWIACVLWVMWKWCMIKHHSFNHFNVVLVSFSFVFCYLQIMKSSTIVLLFSIFVLSVAGKQFYLCIAVSNTASSQKK